MRAWVRTAGVLTVGALGLLFWLGHQASADVPAITDPHRMQPKMPGVPEPSPPPAEEPQPTGVEATEPEAPPAGEPETTPVVEEAEPASVTDEGSAPVSEEAAVPASPDEVTVPTGQAAAVRSASVPATASYTAAPAPTDVARPPSVEHTDASSGGAVHDLGVFLSEAVSACVVALGSGAGAPALIGAVLTMTLLFAGPRRSRPLWLADEKVPEFLYARRVIAPG